jgi:hypothetical protein
MSAALTLSVFGFALKSLSVIVYVPASTPRMTDVPLKLLVISNGILF